MHDEPAWVTGISQSTESEASNMNFSMYCDFCKYSFMWAYFSQNKQKKVVANLQKLAKVPGDSCRTPKRFYYILLHLKLLIPLVTHNKVKI